MSLVVHYIVYYMNKKGIKYSSHTLHRHVYTVDTHYLDIGYSSLNIIYTFILYKSTFVSQHFAYLDMF